MHADAAPNAGEGAPEGAHAEREAWKEVGQQFRQLGQGLAAAFHAAWNNEEMRGQAQEMKSGLEALANEVGRAVKETAESPEVKQAAEDAVRAGRQAIRESRPHLLAALHAVNRELQTLIEKMEAPEAPGSDETGEAR